MSIFKRTSNKELCERLVERQKRVEELEEQVRSMKKATGQVEMLLDAILYELVNKYGKRYGKLVIPMPDASVPHDVKCEKVGDEYILTIAAEDNE